MREEAGSRQRLLYGAIVFAAAVAVYLRGLSGGFVWDDTYLIGQTKELFATKGLSGFFTTPFLAIEGKASPNYFRPLVFVSIWVDEFLGGGSPFLFHLTNLFLHGLASLLCFRLFYCFIDARAAFWGALLFAVHPVHTESVYFVSGRTDILAAIFTIAVAIFWARDLKGESGGIAARLWGSFFLLCALLTKEASFFAPAAILGWDVLRAGRGGEGNRRRIGWLAALGVPCALVLLYRFGYDGGVLSPLKVPPPDSPSVITASDRFWGFAEYLKLMTLPFPLKAYYTPSSVGPSAAVIVGALSTLLLYLALGTKSRGREGLSGLLWFLVFLLPVLGVIPARVPVVGERFLYLPSVSFCLMAGLGLQVLGEKQEALKKAWLPAVLLAPLCLVTALRAEVWKSDKTLFTHITKTAPDYFGGHYNLAIKLFGEKSYEEAAEEYLLAAAIKPEDFRPWAGAGRSYFFLGKPDMAAGYYQKALALSPGALDMRLEYAGVLNMLGDDGKQLAELEYVVKNDPHRFEAWNILGVLNRRNGRIAKAEECFRKALDLRPGHPGILKSLIALLMETGRQGEVPQLLSSLEKSDPAEAEAVRRKLEGWNTVETGARQGGGTR